MVGRADEVEGDIENQRDQVAARIAREIRRSGSPNVPKLAKVSALIDAFRTTKGATPLNCVRTSLERHGLSLNSGWTDGAGHPDIRRAGVVEVVPVASDGPSAEPGDVDDAIHMTLWTAGEAERGCRFPPDQKDRKSADVLWFDIDPLLLGTPVRSAVNPRRGKAVPDASRVSAAPMFLELEDEIAIGHRAAIVHKELAEFCPGLEEEMVRDLLREDPQPKVETYGDENPTVRGASVVAAVARELPVRGEPTGARTINQVVFQLLEIIVGDGWIVTCWHPNHIYGEHATSEAVTAMLKEPFLAQVRQHWVASPGSASGGSSSLGLHLIRTFIDSYDASHRMMERWMASWEVDFHTSLSHLDNAARLESVSEDLNSILYMTTDIRRRLTAIQHAPLTAPDRRWFPQARCAHRMGQGARRTPRPVGIHSTAPLIRPRPASMSSRATSAPTWMS